MDIFKFLFRKNKNHDDWPYKWRDRIFTYEEWIKIQSEFGKQSIRLSDYDKGGPLEGQSPEDLLLVGLSPEEMTARDNQKNVLNEVQLKLDAEFTAKKALRENGGILARVLSRPVVIIGILSLLIGGAFLYSCNKTKQNKTTMSLEKISDSLKNKESNSTVVKQAVDTSKTAVIIPEKKAANQKTDNNPKITPSDKKSKGGGVVSWMSRHWVTISLALGFLLGLFLMKVSKRRILKLSGCVIALACLLFFLYRQILSSKSHDAKSASSKMVQVKDSIREQALRDSFARVMANDSVVVVPVVDTFTAKELEEKSLQLQQSVQQNRIDSIALAEKRRLLEQEKADHWSSKKHLRDSAKTLYEQGKTLFDSTAKSSAQKSDTIGSLHTALVQSEKAAQKSEGDYRDLKKKQQKTVTVRIAEQRWIGYALFIALAVSLILLSFAKAKKKPLAIAAGILLIALFFYPRIIPEVPVEKKKDTTPDTTVEKERDRYRAKVDSLKQVVAELSKEKAPPVVVIDTSLVKEYELSKDSIAFFKKQIKELQNRKPSRQPTPPSIKKDEEWSGGNKKAFSNLKNSDGWKNGDRSAFDGLAPQPRNSDGKN